MGYIFLREIHFFDEVSVETSLRSRHIMRRSCSISHIAVRYSYFKVCFKLGRYVLLGLEPPPIAPISESLGFAIGPHLATLY